MSDVQVHAIAMIKSRILTGILTVLNGFWLEER